MTQRPQSPFREPSDTLTGSSASPADLSTILEVPEEDACRRDCCVTLFLIITWPPFVTTFLFWLLPRLMTRSADVWLARPVWLTRLHSLTDPIIPLLIPITNPHHWLLIPIIPWLIPHHWLLRPIIYAYWCSLIHYSFLSNHHCALLIHYCALLIHYCALPIQ